MASPVEQVWVRAVRELGGAAEPATGAAADLVRRYQEAHRRYHTLAHVEAVLRDCAWLAGELELTAVDRAVADLAACAHDVVYGAEPGTDERASAAWASEQLSACGLPPEAVERVRGIVLATITHTTDAADPAGGAVLDADLAILAAPPDHYARYVAGVRQEYSAVPDDGWRSGRAAVLRNLLARPVLFATGPARRRWEVPARRNVARELAGLSGDQDVS
jgi:predicted metal-dependent HD superfamily phosphohydrolase